MLDDLRLRARPARPSRSRSATSGGTVRVELNHTDPSVLPAGLPARRQRHPDPRRRRSTSPRGLRRRPRQQGPAAAGEGRLGRAGRRGVPRRAAPSTRAGPAWPSSRSTPGRDRRSCTTDGTLELEAARDLPCHTGLVLLSERGSALGRVLPDKRCGWSAATARRSACTAAVAEQRVALDLLLDPEVGIVSLGGRAGTGKSALALCAGLEAVLERRQHRKVVVFRPLYAVGGQELGYLPGHRGREDGARGARRSSTRLGALVTPEVIEEVLERGHARGAAAHPHPRPLAARRVRHRRRGAVAGAQRAADRAVPDRRRTRGSCSPTTSRSATTCGSAGTTASSRSIEKLKGHPLFAHVTLTRSERSQIAALVTEMLGDLGDGTRRGRLRHRSRDGLGSACHGTTMAGVHRNANPGKGVFKVVVVPVWFMG